MIYRSFITEKGWFFNKIKSSNNKPNHIKITDPNQRKAEYNLIRKIAKDILAKNGNIKGLSMYKEEPGDDAKENFIAGKRNNVWIWEFDAWEGTNNQARNQAKYDEFLEKAQDIITQLKNAIKENDKLHGKIDWNSDWDDGWIEYILYY